MNPAPPDAGATLAAGARLAERFEIRRFLSSGASGEVYAAFDHKLGEDVAIKLLRPEIAHDARVVERFRREIQLSRRVAHPNVCRTFNLERQPGAGADLVFVSMQLLEGETLEARLSRGPLAEAEALPLLEQVAAGLDAAHAQGVIHRDLKPENVMLCGAGGARAYITDFGLARSVSPERPGLVSSGPGLRGTPHAMAPEQVEDGALGPWTDVYALGVLAYRMVTGAWPFEADTPVAVAVKRLTHPPRPPRERRPDLDPRWEAAILQALQRDPAARPASGAAFVALLSGQAPPVPAAGPRRAVLVAGALAAALASAATLALASRTRALDAGQAAPPPVASAVRPAVAVLAFTPPSADEEWIGEAFGELLAAEMRAGSALRAIEPAQAAARGAGSGPLGADFGVDGRLARGEAGELRLEAVLVDLHSGRRLLTLAERGELRAVAAAAGRQLRAALGAPALADPAGLRRALPADAAAAQAYAEGLRLLRAFDAAAARDRLQASLEREPGFAPARAALSRAFTLLGLGPAAEAEARRAFELSSDLAQPDRLAVEARWRETQRDWKAAIEIHRALLGFFPDDLEHGLALAAALHDDHRPREALATLARLRHLPAPHGTDPRLDLAEARAWDEAGDLRRAREAATRAIERAAALGADQVRAWSLLERVEVAVELSDHAGVDADERAARAAFARSGDRFALARLADNRAWRLYEQGRFDEARAEWRSSLQISRELGYRRGESVAADGLATLDDDQGRYAEAIAGYALANEIARETGARRGLAVGLYNESLPRGALAQFDAVARLHDEALAICRELGETRLVGSIRQNQGEVLRARGELAAARAAQEDAVRIHTEHGRRSKALYALSSLGQLAADRGELAEARRLLEGVARERDGLGEPLPAARTRLGLAEALLLAGDAAAALPLATAAADAYRGRNGDWFGRAEAIRARALLRLGRRDEAQAALAAVAAQEAATTAPMVQASLRLALAEEKPAAEAVALLLAEARRLASLGLRLQAWEAAVEAGLRARAAGQRVPAEAERARDEALQAGFAALADRAS